MPKLNILVGTMYGGALDVAEQVKPLFEQAGYAVEIIEQPSVDDIVSGDADLALFCVSTTGSGDFPGSFVPFVRQLRDQSPALTTLRYGLIALGDSSYGDTLGERLEIDAMETFMADDAAVPWVEEWIVAQQLEVA